jgi:hypothetical protein
MRQAANLPHSSSAPMTLDEARSVMWLRTYRKPLGELLDEGFLTQTRLEWAAANAYDRKLKQAAGVLLDWMKRAPASGQPAPLVSSPSPAEPLPAVQAGITLEQARAIPWPFGPLKGQAMGSLVDTRQVILKDLAYAIDNAWDQRVRRAAIVLAAVLLNQAVKEPPPSAGPLKVISAGRSYAERRQLFWRLIQGFIAGAVLSPAVIFMIIEIIRLPTLRPGKPLGEIVSTPIGVCALIFVIAFWVGVAWLTNRLFSWTIGKLDRQVDAYRQGQEGEEQAVEMMRQNLDGNWTLFRNVVLPGRNPADIDAVLVGPPGVWTLEVKTFTGEYRNIGEHWEYRAGSQWKLLKASPSRQAQSNAIRLSNFFKADGLTQWVTPAVVWADSESPLSVENPAVAVWRLGRLPEELGNIWQGQAMPEATQARIIEKLTALCQKRPS